MYYFFLKISNNFETNSLSHSVRIGLDAGLNEDKTSFRSNVIIGYSSGKNISTGYGNVFVGSESGRFTSNGYSNTFVGDGSGRGNNTSFRNTFFHAKEKVWYKIDSNEINICIFNYYDFNF